MRDIERARALVLRYGWNATAYQILNPGIDFWFSAAGDGVVGYAERHGVRVVAGAPICAAERLVDVADEFEAAASEVGHRVAYFGVERRFERLRTAGGSHAGVVIGAQPSWPPEAWPRMLATHASLRQQVNRAANKGVVAREWPASRATDDPRLRSCLDEWLGTRGLPPLHFMVEPETLSNLIDRRVFVAERGSRVVGFLVASPVPGRCGWLIEQLVRGAGAPNGTAEMLVDAAVSAMHEDGDHYVTLGLAPLSRRAGGPGPSAPLWMRLLLGWTRAHVQRFYDFAGLEDFKAKFRPAVWEPVYMVAARRRMDARSLHAVVSAFSDRSVTSTVARALMSALRQEIRRLGWPRTRPELEDSAEDGR